MIFPILRGFVSPHLAPLTVFLFAINLFVFLATYDEYERTDARMDELITDRAFLETQGSAFSVMISRDPAKFSRTLIELARKSYSGDVESRKILGSLAIRNVEFMTQATDYEFGGDEVAVADWRGKFKELKSLQFEHPSYLWGISRLKTQWVQFITYQFSHSGFLHLFWNMVFLLIFGMFIETKLGGSFVVVTYFGGGLLGAWIFSQLSGISSAPLVGASAAVSALIALVGFGWLSREKIRFFFWLLPAEGYFGFVALPSWLVLIVSLIPDVSGYLAASQDFGSVAYAAHLGGALWGFVIAMSLDRGWLVEENDPSSPAAPPSSDHRPGARI